MRSLPISLLLVTIGAVFGVGYFLDTMFERYSGKPTDSISQISTFGQGVADILNGAENPEDVLAHWRDDGGYSVGLSEKEGLPLPDSLQASLEAGEPLILDSEQGLSIHYLLQRHGQVLIVQNAQLSTGEDDALAWIFTGVFYLGTLVAVLIWLKPLLNRIRILRRSTKAFGAGDLNSRVTLQGVTYIRDIEEDFNRMADRIQQLVEDNKLLTSSVSHDLRTPLARLRFGIDTLNEGSSSSSETEKYLFRINNDLNEMEALVDSHLQFASLDNVMNGVEKSIVSLRDLLGECVAQFYDNVVFVEVITESMDTDDSLNIPGCIEHLASLFNNILQNAFKHAERFVRVEMLRNKNSIIIDISDDGPGIPPAQRNQMMKPFVRGKRSSDKGYGLGLAVAARIAKHHNAEIDISSCETLDGAKIRVRLAVIVSQ